ncbi:hypothetical protein VZT92_008332 [Zoarces viviparus]|uniref:Uncharacterized protein n=1 Tax=Zoarces viviparus TaxID=48416 RepID=A0AAW1FE64_ZOAVI
MYANTLMPLFLNGDSAASTHLLNTLGANESPNRMARYSYLYLIGKPEKPPVCRINGDVELSIREIDCYKPMPRPNRATEHSVC